ncbi:MAG: CinA family protein [candidate division KSB1 bacterium]|nr:CinA family protein [candidate division KSB1 bacterium]MDZ7333556.1 CinA family protein [candidate division KSB1 bacterium]MDZ7357001.1 CinA family protein [candidate division KSB1 bacterium]MDZ7375231.1 CinA family protein [candidate division KSB1 bacterium]MDZ7398670.1 CinA family protein [candidate division KSB1 bacterium]
MDEYIKLITALKERSLTIATAESCTGGLIAKLLTDIAGASEVFIGGVVCYSNEMKMKWLGVKQQTLDQHGAVSHNTVAELLDGIVRQTGADCAIAVSGIAGPTGGTPEKPIGTVFIGVSWNDQILIEQYHFKGSRQEIRDQAARQAAILMFDLLKRQIASTDH